MKKNLFLNVFTVLLLLSTSFGVPSANAADPGDGLQFCFITTTNADDGKPELEFRQKLEKLAKSALIHGMIKLQRIIRAVANTVMPTLTLTIG